MNIDEGRAKSITLNIAHVRKKIRPLLFAKLHTFVCLNEITLISYKLKIALGENTHVIDTGV